MSNKKLNRQIDLQVSGLHVREAAEGEERSRTIEGYAVVFGVRSVNLVPWSSYREVYEIMEPGSITNELLQRSDVVLTAFHDNTAILGRWRNGKGTLNLQLDKRGLRVECTLADTERANELLSAIERGDITGMSFAFRADEEDSENGVSYEKIEDRNAEGKEVWLRHVKKVTGLYDVTIAGHPAYEQTTVDTREVDEFLDSKVGEPAALVEKREQEAKEEQERKLKELREKEELARLKAAEIAKENARRQRVLRANEVMLEEMTY
jgi:HK97 family phage prohead protease